MACKSVVCEDKKDEGGVRAVVDVLENGYAGAADAATLATGLQGKFVIVAHWIVNV